jgi:hypothetical protein
MQYYFVNHSIDSLMLNQLKDPTRNYKNMNHDFQQSSITKNKSRRNRRTG